jgi:ADP-ribose pyrophosphatase YjhB (NUDIX family)
LKTKICAIIIKMLSVIKKFRAQTIRSYSQDLKLQQVHQFASYCGFCGTPYQVLQWPRTCSCCGNLAYRNPIPVAVGLVPILNNNRLGLLLIKRAIKPFIGGWCMPGGFVDESESWRQTISREIGEETSIMTDPDEFKLVDVHSTPDNTRILIFGVTSKIRTIDAMDNFQPNDEVSSIFVGDQETKLCFSLHQSVYDHWFRKNSFYE